MRAAAELRAILPERVARHIDWDSLQAVHASFVDAALSQRHGDLMFSARLKEGHEAYLWLLFEHQSTIDRWMPLRMLEMAVEFLKGWHKEHPRAAALARDPAERLVIEKHKRLAREEGAQQILLRQLARRFGALPEAVTARVMDAGREELERWSDRILDAASLDDVFAAL